MRYRPIVITLVALLTAWGGVTFFTMPRREDPEFTIRTCVVATRWPGAPALKVEELVTDKLEEALDSIEEVDYLKSDTTTGQSIIFVNLEDRLPPSSIQQVWDKVRAKVATVPMPAPGVRPIVNDDFGDTAVLVMGLYQVPLKGATAVDPSVVYSPRRLEVYAETVRDSIRLHPDVAKVELFGVREEAIYIETDLANWSQVGLTTGSLRQLVESRNIVSPGGSIDTAAGKFNVRPGGEFDAVGEIENVAVAAVANGQTSNRVRLSDIGLEVNRAYRDPPSVLCRFTEPRGTFPAVMLGITMKSGANIVDLCNDAKERVDRLIEEGQVLPRDIAVTPVSMSGDNVTAKIDEVISNVFSAIVIVVIVVYLFVGLSTSLVMAANIPFVVIGTIAIIRMFGVDLEQISLASIIIALGLLVDNAVQVCDQTRTNILAGMQPQEAAVRGAETLLFPMLSGTLTTVAAFLPMLFALTGGSAEYVYSLPVTLSTTLLLSWLFAMSICVILAAAFIRAPADPTRPTAPLPWLNEKLGAWLSRLTARRSSAAPEPGSDNIFLQGYAWTARLAVRYKWATVAVAVALLAATLQLNVSSEFFPQDRRDQFYVNVRLPETATIAQTNEKVRQVEELIKGLSRIDDPDSGEAVERLRTMRTLTGRGGARWALALSPPQPSSNVAEVLVRTTSGEWTESMIRDLRIAVDQGDPDRGLAPISGARVITKRLSMGPAAAPVELRVSGEGFADITRLRRIANQIKELIRREPGTWDVSDSWGVEGFQLDIDIDDEKANLAGVSNAAVADTLNAYFSGLQLTSFREGDHVVPVYFRLRKEERRTLAGLGTAFVEGQNGKVPLNSVARIVPRWQPVRIERRDQNRTIEVSAEVDHGVSGNDVVLRVWNSTEMDAIRESLPPGYTIEIGGALESSQDASVEMMTSFGVSLLLIILILVIQYNGWSKASVILTTLPLAVIGAWFGLWLMDKPLGFMPQLGLLSLFGIVLNTGIIFIEFADLLIENKRKALLEAGEADGAIVGLSGAQFRECLIEAGKQRMLPIFLTTATTIGGLLPLALSGGPLWEGMAWLMIYGLVVATLLTLYVVPALYAIVVESLGVAPIVAAAESTAD